MKKILFTIIIALISSAMWAQRVAPITVKQTTPNFEEMRKQYPSNADYSNALVALCAQLEKEGDALHAVEPQLKAERKVYNQKKKELQAERRDLKKQLRKCKKDEPCKKETRDKIETLKTKFVDLGLFDYDLDAKAESLKNKLAKKDEYLKKAKEEINKLNK